MCLAHSHSYWILYKFFIEHFQYELPIYTLKLEIIKTNLITYLLQRATRMSETFQVENKQSSDKCCIDLLLTVILLPRFSVNDVPKRIT